MELTQALDIYAYHLGTIVRKPPQPRALTLRVALSQGKWALDPDAAIGQEVALDAVNQWAYLSGLVQRYNETVKPVNPNWVLVRGDEIIRLRNALAHGVVLARSPQPPLRLIKFGKAPGSKDKALVQFSAEMTEAWLTEQRRIIWDAINTVGAYLKHLGIGQPPT